MKTLVLILWILTTLTFSLSAHAMRFTNSSGSILGNAKEFVCSTGVTCTMTPYGVLTMVSSPTLVAPLTLESGEIMNNTVDDTVEVISNDEVTTFQITGFEAKNAVLNLYPDQGDDTADKFSLKMSTAGALTFEVNAVAYITHTTSTGAVAMTGSLAGDGGDALSGFLQAQVASTTAAITAAQCGSSFVSNSADVMTLPEASTVLGCRLTFICGTADDFDVNPADGTDTILPTGALTPSAGDAIRCTDAGAGFVLEAIGANSWAVLSTNLTITDVN